MSLGNGQLVYKVVNSGAVFDRVKALSEAATRAGHLPEFADALRFVLDHLQHSPNKFGDPLFHLHHHGQKVCSARHWLIITEYAIDVLSRTVYIRDVRPYPGTDLDAAASSP